MIPANSFRLEWLTSVATCFPRLVVALALIPEAIDFSLIAGVVPKVGLCASLFIALVIPLTGAVPQ